MATRHALVRAYRVDDSYHGTTFSAILPYRRSTTFFVDPQDTSIRMSKVDFDGRLEETTVDLVLASVLLGGATAMTTVHVARLRRRSRRHEALRSTHSP